MTNTPKVDMIWTGRDKFLGGRTIRTGDALRVSRGHARLYKAIGSATEAPAQAADVPVTPEPQPPVQAPAPAVAASQAREPVQRRTTTRNMKAEGKAKPAGKVAKPATRRTYRRRDMKAEE